MKKLELGEARQLAWSYTALRMAGVRFAFQLCLTDTPATTCHSHITCRGQGLLTAPGLTGALLFSAWEGMTPAEGTHWASSPSDMLVAHRTSRLLFNSSLRNFPSLLQLHPGILGTTSPGSPGQKFFHILDVSYTK